MGRDNLLWNTGILRKLYSELSCDVLDGSIRAQLGCNLIISHTLSPLYTLLLLLLLLLKICYCDLCRNFTVRINVVSMRQRIHISSKQSCNFKLPHIFVMIWARTLLTWIHIMDVMSEEGKKWFFFSVWKKIPESDIKPGENSPLVIFQIWLRIYRAIILHCLIILAYLCYYYIISYISLLFPHSFHWLASHPWLQTPGPWYLHGWPGPCRVSAALCGHRWLSVSVFLQYHSLYVLSSVQQLGAADGSTESSYSTDRMGLLWDYLCSTG